MRQPSFVGLLPYPWSTVGLSMVMDGYLDKQHNTTSKL